MQAREDSVRGKPMVFPKWNCSRGKKSPAHRSGARVLRPPELWRSEPWPSWRPWVPEPTPGRRNLIANLTIRNRRNSPDFRHIQISNSQLSPVLGFCPNPSSLTTRPFIPPAAVAGSWRRVFCAPMKLIGKEALGAAATFQEKEPNRHIPLLEFPATHSKQRSQPLSNRHTFAYAPLTRPPAKALTEAGHQISVAASLIEANRT